jgi:hypothetical protein
VPITTVEVVPGIFVVGWKDPKSEAYVTHVEDYNNGEVVTSIMLADGTHTVMTGTWTRVR